MKNSVLLCTGLSGSGKTYFIQNNLPAGLFYNLKSATTRAPRSGEVDGEKYFFRDEQYFENTALVTNLWVNRNFWQPGDKKWLYGVPESEVFEHMGQNFTYDVIEPQYARQMIDWFNMHGLDSTYMFKVIWFLPPRNSIDTVVSRANMPNDLAVRCNNTCNIEDFLDCGLRPDYILRPRQGQYDARLDQYIGALYDCFMGHLH